MSNHSRKFVALFLLLISGQTWAACTTGPGPTCEVGSGHTYATIQLCATAAVAGQTCTVFAGTYNERPTIPAGTSGNPITIAFNGTDQVSVLGFVLGNFNNITGSFAPRQGTVTTQPASGGPFISNPSSPTTSCLSMASSDIVTGVVGYACGTLSIGSNTILKNSTFSYLDSTTTIGTTGTGTFLQMSTGDNFNLIDNNEVSHSSDFSHFTGSHNIIRNNFFHDAPSTDCGSNSGNCHVDYVEAEPGAGNTQDNLFEGNQEVNISGASSANGHGFLTQGDICAGNCFHVIQRFNEFVHISGGAVIDDNNLNAGVNPGFYRVINYNNTWADMVTNTGSRVGGAISCYTHNSIDAADLNNIFHITGSVTDFNANCFDASTLASSAHGHGLMFCTGSPCTVHGATYGSGHWLDDATNKLTDPLFTNYSSGGLGDLSLTSASPARNAGAALTTVNGTITSSATLVVANADYFWADTTIAGVQADCIRVSSWSNAPVCISSINYATNTLTLASPISATTGDSVWLYSKSDGKIVATDTTAPDMGAIPFNPAVTPAPSFLLRASR